MEQHTICNIFKNVLFLTFHIDGAPGAKNRMKCLSGLNDGLMKGQADVKVENRV